MAGARGTGADRVPAAGPRVAYLVSRFPHVTETFIVREMDAVTASGVDLELRSLYPRVDSTDSEASLAWMPSLRRPGPRESARAALWWAGRRPGALLGIVLRVLVSHAASPGVLVRALGTVPVAAAHARELSGSAVRHVHAHYATYPALAAWICRRLTGVSYSFTAHAHDLFLDQSMLERKVRDAVFVATVSQFNEQFIGRRSGGCDTPVHVVHCGVRPDLIAFRPRIPSPSGEVRAVCVASLQEYKGHRYLLDALADARLSRVTLELVGDGPLRPVLLDQIRRLGLQDRVRLRGALPEEDVASVLATADLFVLPSTVSRTGQMEGVPVALMEAMAHGVPVVATRLSGVPELVSCDQGVLADPGNSVDLAEAILRVLEDPSASRRRVAHARRRVEESYDLRKSGKVMAELLREALASHSTSRVT